jgi:hypothetical protein
MPIEKLFVISLEGAVFNNPVMIIGRAAHSEPHLRDQKQIIHRQTIGNEGFLACGQFYRCVSVVYQGTHSSFST